MEKLYKAKTVWLLKTEVTPYFNNITKIQQCKELKDFLFYVGLGSVEETKKQMSYFRDKFEQRTVYQEVWI